MMIAIEDNLHGELWAKFQTFDEAIAELQHRASIPWDQPPNKAPCKSWRTCGREYEVNEYDDSHEPWKLLRRIIALKISAKGVEWVDGFEEAWAANGL